MTSKENNEMSARIELLGVLLQEYKKTYAEMEDLSSSVTKATGSCYSDIFNRNLPEILELLEKHNKNIKRTTQINEDITASVNKWYEFTRNPDEISKLLYPLRFYIKGKALKKNIRSLNDELSAIVIENRFIAEQATIWKHKLETDVIVEIRRSQAYSDYEKASAQLETVISELKYLIPAIPGLCPADISPAGIDCLKEKLLQIEAA